MQENFAAASRFPKPWTHLTDAVLYLASYTLVVLFPASNSIILKFSGAALQNWRVGPGPWNFISRPLLRSLIG